MNSLTDGSAPAKVALAFGAIYLIWGSTYLAIRYAVETLPPLLMMGTRHLVAGALLYSWAQTRGSGRPARQQWISAAVVGAFLFLGSHGALAWAQQKIPSGLAAILFAALPFWAVLLDWVRPGGFRPERGVMGGLLLGLAGVVVLVKPVEAVNGGSMDVLGAVVVLLSAFLWACGTISAQRVKRPSSLFLFTGMQLLAGGGLLFLAGLAFGEGERLMSGSVSLRSILSLGYLIVFGSLVALTAYNWLLSVTTAVRVTTIAYVTPVIAILFGWVIGKETLTVQMIVASAIIVASVGIVVTRKKQFKGRDKLNEARSFSGEPEGYSGEFPGE